MITTTPIDRLAYERACHAAGTLPAGVDEAGRGPLAGPVVAACVALPPGVDVSHLEEVRDSKKCTEKKRERLFYAILQTLPVGVGEASVAEIAQHNILQATFLAMRRAVESMPQCPGLLLVDGNHSIPQLAIAQRALVGGDDLALTIGAASIVAKVTRDRLLISLHEQYPHYGFAQHKGYGTAGHVAALRAHGPCPEHRQSFLRNVFLEYA